MPPKVSVLITLYNKAPFVGEAIQSVLAQTYTDLEVLVVDDASTDGGLDVVRAFSDPRIRILESPVNTGRPAAANRGFAAARGDHVAILDADDIMLPGRIARQVEHMEKFPAVDVLGSWVSTFGAYERAMHGPVAHDAIRVNMFFDNAIVYGSCMIRRALLLNTGIRCDEAWRHQGMDVLFLFDLGHRGGYANIPEVLTRYRVGAQNMRHGRDQRTELAFQTRAKFDRVGLSASDADIGMHLTLLGLLPHGPLPDARALRDWVVRLKAWNEGAGVYPAKLFADEVEGRWRSLFHRFADREPRTALLHAWLSGNISVGTMYYLAKVSLVGPKTSEV
ncbi:MAG: glycosyltransferase family 2 protein [Flavobacteriales bacterium]|nr:glycosyltransferase family 2 protein [Flavobacteriales bacterium]